MIHPLARKAIFVIYNLMLHSLYFAVVLFSKFHKPWQTHLGLRRSAIRYFRKHPIEKCELFFCSSAGEYEQALPLINALEPERKAVILFFSPSGLEYARKRKEHRPHLLAPLDLPSAWREFFSYVRPTNVFIVRHELWPNFIREAARHSQVNLIDASINSNSIANKFLYRFLSKDIKNIFTVSLYDLNVLKYICLSSDVHLSGDTKYDRVAERKKKNEKRIARYKQRLEDKFPGKNYLIVGSAWAKDTEIILQSLRLLSEEERTAWRVFIAPHDLSEKMLELQSELIRKFGFISKTYAEYKSENMEDTEIVLVDRLGILFELYGGFDLAFIGGALHHKIHNVLEPAIFGLNLGFGPRYHNQKEARFIAEKELARVISTPEEGAEWLRSHSKGKPKEDDQLIKYMDSLMGATDQIVKTL